MRCLVTGVAGFAGSHLAELLMAKGFEVTGLALPGEDLSRLDPIRQSLDLAFADIADADALAAALGGIDPAYVFHLAAVASVPASLTDPSAATRVNTIGTQNLLAAFNGRGLSRFVYISSADVYGHLRPADIPVRETQPLRPSNPYAASKAASEIICTQYWRTFAMPVVILRPFNHTGARQGPGFAPSDFARAISRIEKGLTPPALAVGNLESQRDYSDVRDIVQAYLLGARHGEPGEIYNISSGRPVRIRHLLDTLLCLSTAAVEVVADPAKARPSDTAVVAGDSSKARRRTGWLPTRDLENALNDLLEWWRTRD